MDNYNLFYLSLQNVGTSSEYPFNKYRYNEYRHDRPDHPDHAADSPWY